MGPFKLVNGLVCIGYMVSTSTYLQTVTEDMSNLFMCNAFTGNTKEHKQAAPSIQLPSAL